MIHQTSTIAAASDETFALNQTLDWLNNGIYVATYRLCHKQYDGRPQKNF